MESAQRRARKRAERKKRGGNLQPVKPRTTGLRVDFGKDQTISAMSAPNELAELVFSDEVGGPAIPKTIEVEVTYPRAKGAKVLTRVPMDPTAIKTDVNRSLLRYDWVFAVDTNTRQFGGELVSVSVSLLLRNFEFTSPTWSMNATEQIVMELRNPMQPPERLGWHHVLRACNQSGISGRVAVIVDSDLGVLSALNRRVQELLPAFLLPENVTLIYASGDAGGREFMGNRAISECDRRARTILNRIQNNQSPSMGFQTNMPHYCDRYRFWTPEEITQVMRS